VDANSASERRSAVLTGSPADPARVAGFSVGLISRAIRSRSGPRLGLSAMGIERSIEGDTWNTYASVAQIVFGSDLIFWVLKRHVPSLFARVPGMPSGFGPTPDERQRIQKVEESLLPVRPRKAGALFDAYVSNPDVQGYPLQDIAAPTLIINAKDDGLSAFENAAHAATRIPGSKLIAIERGGPLDAWEREAHPDRGGGAPRNKPRP
jgi:pimeloyl-ACP methyl ester carboxylesterase